MDSSTRQYGRNDVDYETWYSHWMKHLARTHAVADLERALYGINQATRKATKSHLRAIQATGSMQSQSMRRAHTGNVVAVGSETASALRGALEIHELFPEHAAPRPNVGAKLETTAPAKN